MKTVSTALERVEEFLATGDDGLGAVYVIASDEKSGDKAKGDADEEGGHIKRGEARCGSWFR